MNPVAFGVASPDSRLPRTCRAFCRVRVVRERGTCRVDRRDVVVTSIDTRRDRQGASIETPLSRPSQGARYPLAALLGQKADRLMTPNHLLSGRRSHAQTRAGLVFEPVQSSSLTRA